MAKLFTLNRFSLLVLAVLFLTAFAANSAVNGQGSRQIYIERRIDTMNRQAKEFERDSMARDGNNGNNAETAKRTRQIRIEIEEDLNALQSAYNNIVIALRSGTALRPDFAAETARAVRKNAVRLKGNLALPTEKDDGAKPAMPAFSENENNELKALCKTIYDFVTNPIFDPAAGLDAKNGIKARRDLETIVMMAERLANHTNSSSK